MNIPITLNRNAEVIRPKQLASRYPAITAAAEMTAAATATGKREHGMGEIRRFGSSRRWADVVVHRGVASWVEVADDLSLDARGQIAQVLAQVDATLEAIGSDRTQLLQVLVYLADGRDAATLNALWDDWVPAGHPPVRAMVQVGLGTGCKVELVVTAAVDDAPGAG